MTLIVTPVERRPATPPSVPAIDTSRGALEAMFRSLWPAMRANEFGAIVGEDRPGRVPALIAAKVINGWNRAHRRRTIPVIFMPSSPSPKDQADIEAAFAARTHLLTDFDHTKRVLVVSATTGDGHSLASIGRQLTKAGLRWDVAVPDGRGYSVRTPESDRERVDAARRAWETEQASLRSRRDEVQDHLDRLLESSRGDIAQLEERRREWARQRDAVGAELRHLESDGPPTGRWMRDKRAHERESRMADLRGRMARYVTDTTPNEIEKQLATLATTVADRSRVLRADIVQLSRRFESAPDLSAVGADDTRPVWPDGTRLFAGRDRTGFNTNVAGSARTAAHRRSGRRVRADARRTRLHPAARERAAAVHQAVDASAAALLDSLAWETDFTRDEVLPAGRAVIDHLCPDVRQGKYGVIVGDDTSGRFFALMVGLAINHYLRAEGRPPLPIIFLEGIRHRHARGQVRAFKRFHPLLRHVDRSKQALIVTDNVSSGKSAGSLAWRLHDAGFTSHIVALSDMWRSEADLIDSRRWPPGTTGFGAGYIAQGVLIDNQQASGLRQRTKRHGDQKFSKYSLVIRDGWRRDGIVRNRRDVHEAAHRLGERLRSSEEQVSEIERLAPHMKVLARGLSAAVRGDEYCAIIGQDSTGRIPALIIGRAVNVWRRAHGRERLPILFVARGASADRLDARNAPALTVLPDTGRALLFSDTMRAGAGSIAWWLHHHGIASDLVLPHGPDCPTRESVDAGMIPPDARLLSVEHDPYEVRVGRHAEVTGVQCSEVAARTTAVTDHRRREVVIARRRIDQLVPGVVEALS